METPEHYSNFNSLLRQANQERVGRGKSRRVPLQIASYSLTLYEQPGLGLGSTIEEKQGEVLCHYLCNNPELVKGKRCIELGAGVGLAGIICSLLGGDVELSDKEALVPLLQQNIDANTTAEHKIRTRALVWGEELETPLSPYDVILINDVVVEGSTYAHLVKTLTDLSDVDTLILLSYRNKMPRDIDTLSRMTMDSYSPIASPQFNPHKRGNIFDELQNNFRYRQLTGRQEGECILFQIQKKARFWLLEK